MKREQSSRKLVVAAASGILLLSLVGCQPATTAPSPSDEIASGPTATATPTPSPTPTPTPEPVPPTPIERLEQVRDLVANSSVGCADWRLAPEFSGTAGQCGSEGVLIFIHPSLADRNTVLQLNLDSMEPNPFIVGPDFLVNVSSLDDLTRETLASEIGGILWVAPDPIPTS